MKKLLIAAAILTSLAGCASTDKKWEAYAVANDCEYSGERTMRREFLNMSQHTSNGAMNLNPAPQLEFRPVYKYNCKNGDVWTYSAPS